MQSETPPASTRYRLLPRLSLALFVLQSSVVLLLLCFPYFRLPHHLRYAAQLRSSSIAAQLANRIQPTLLSSEPQALVQQQFQSLESINSEVRAYLLDEHGKVLLTSTDRLSRRTQISLAQVRRLLEPEIPEQEVLGDDPDSEIPVLISIAPVRLATGSGFVYVTIKPPLIDYLATARGALTYLLLVLPLIAFVSVLSWWMMRLYATYLLGQFRGLVDAARALALGDRSQRAPVVSSDEIGHLASSFNATADAILFQEDEIARAERSRRLLVAGVLHDLRAPLGAMRGILEILSGAGSRSNSEFARLLATIGSCAQRQHRFVESLEQLSEVEVAADSFNFAPVDLDQIIRSAIEVLEQRAKEHGITLRYEALPVPIIAGDSFWLSRAITNVVVNAINYGRPSGTVTVSVRESAGSVQCSVKDDGVGIAPEDVERIFDHFFRAGSAAGKEGSGLGLSVVKKVVDRHRGNVEVQSELDRGTLFNLRFPIEGHTPLPAPENLRDSGLRPIPPPEARPSLLTLTQPRYFLSLLASGSWLTTQLLSPNAWAGVLLVCQLAFLWLPFQSSRFRALLPLHALFMGAMFLFLDREGPTAGRAVIAHNVTLGAMIFIGFAPVSRVAKWCYGVLTVASIIGSAFWFDRFELVSAGIGGGGALGALLIVAFRSRRGREFRIRFALSVATVMTFSLLTIGYESFMGIMFLSDMATRASLRREIPNVRKLLESTEYSPSPLPSYDEARARLVQYNPAIAGLVTSPDLRPMALFGERGRDLRYEQGEKINLRGVCSPHLPVGLRLAQREPFSLCEEFTSTHLQRPARFILARKSGRTDAIERRQLENAVAELLLLIPIFIAVAVRALGSVLYRSFTAPLSALLRSVLAAREQSTLPDIELGRVSELLEINDAFRDMVETLRKKQSIVAEADEKLRELVTALLKAVEPFHLRLNQLLPLCKDAQLSGDSQPPQALTRELLALVDGEIEVVDQLFTLTKLDLGELTLERDLFTLEELIWAADIAPGADPDTAPRQLQLELEPSNDYFAVDSRQLLKVLKLCVEELHQQLPLHMPICISARHNDQRLYLGVRPHGPYEPQPSTETIRLNLIRKLVEALGGVLQFDGAAFNFSVTTQIGGDPK